MRYHMDCRNTSSVKNCSLSMAADTREEVLEAAVYHAIAVHGAEDTDRLREDVSANIQETEETIPV